LSRTQVSYYRKKLMLDPSWQGSHIEIYVEAALSYSTWWFQGVQLAVRTSGYTSAVLRIDNVPGIGFGNGSLNELVVFVDGTQKTGCVACAHTRSRTARTHPSRRTERRG